MPPLRQMKRFLVTNRGEIATRIISTARELGLEVYGVYTENDVSHTYALKQAIKLPSPAAYLNIDVLVKIVKDHKIDTVHPGYGFLSESADFARRMAEIGVLVVGPGADILEQTGDKIKARHLAEDCGVPVLPALQVPTNELTNVQEFAETWGYPIIIKAVDGGGGRGIRIVHNKTELPGLMKRALAESPSGQVYAEKAAIGGYRHVEVQIIGDNNGNIRNLWERECSIQRRFQKVVEFAPSSIRDKNRIKVIIEAAMRMAKRINYVSLGTFEFLVHESLTEFYFIEVNPRLQVEHTITEMIFSGIDLVKLQLLITDRSQSLDVLLRNVSNLPETRPTHPNQYSIQLRITAESVEHDWSLSVGRINAFYFPTGNGIRVDTHLRPPSNTVSTDFDSLLAKVIVTASTWDAVISKARRALEDVKIEGVTTNLDALRGILAHPNFVTQSCDTQWLEKSLPEIMKYGTAATQSMTRRQQTSPISEIQTAVTTNVRGATLLRPADKFRVSLSQPGDKFSISSENHISIDKIQQNNFPDTLSAFITYTDDRGISKPFSLQVKRTRASAGSVTAEAKHRKGDRANPNHVVTHFPGKLVEILVEEGDVVEKGQVCAVMSQMKMELEIRAEKAGRIVWTFDGNEEEEIGEGTLIAEIRELKDDLSKL